MICIPYIINARPNCDPLKEQARVVLISLFMKGNNGATVATRHHDNLMCFFGALRKKENTPISNQKVLQLMKIKINPQQKSSGHSFEQTYAQDKLLQDGSQKKTGTVCQKLLFILIS